MCVHRDTEASISWERHNDRSRAEVLHLCWVRRWRRSIFFKATQLVHRDIKGCDPGTVLKLQATFRFPTSQRPRPSGTQCHQGQRTVQLPAVMVTGTALMTADFLCSIPSGHTSRPSRQANHRTKELYQPGVQGIVDLTLDSTEANGSGRWSGRAAGVTFQLHCEECRAEGHGLLQRRATHPRTGRIWSAWTRSARAFTALLPSTVSLACAFESVGALPVTSLLFHQAGTLGSPNSVMGVNGELTD